MIHGLARSFDPSRQVLAQHLLNSDLDRWERAGILSAPDKSVTALAFRIDSLSVSLADLERPYDAPERAWFHPSVNSAEARHTREMIRETSQRLSALRRDLRSVLDHQAAARSQTLLAAFAALLLAPGLAAAILSAFTKWPTDDDSIRWATFGGMSFVLTAAALAVVRRIVGPTGVSAWLARGVQLWRMGPIPRWKLAWLVGGLLLLGIEVAVAELIR
jgi:hypothetical protein